MKLFVLTQQLSWLGEVRSWGLKCESANKDGLLHKQIFIKKGSLKQNKLNEIKDY